MATFEELSMPVRLFLKAYPWRHIHPTPWTQASQPLNQSRIAVVSSAGFIRKGQEPFDDHVKGGDPSFRWIEQETPTENLMETHRSQSFDHSGIQADPNLALPLRRLETLAEEGTIGSVNHRHASCMGSLTAPGKFTREAAPAIADGLIQDGVNRVLLVPV